MIYYYIYILQYIFNIIYIYICTQLYTNILACPEDGLGLSRSEPKAGRGMAGHVPSSELVKSWGLNPFDQPKKKMGMKLVLEDRVKHGKACFIWI